MQSVDEIKLMVDAIWEEFLKSTARLVTTRTLSFEALKLVPTVTQLELNHLKEMHFKYLEGVLKEKTEYSETENSTIGGVVYALETCLISPSSVKCILDLLRKLKKLLEGGEIHEGSSQR